ncbi:MAG TPA: SpoIIE family protein phosphatase, partial [Rhodothermales bacterium]|nr:SpoIIE family protein phosphatase [Rhodothermales bacterium]
MEERQISSSVSRRAVNVQDTLSTVDAIGRLLTDAAFDLNPLLNEVVRLAAQEMGLRASALRLIDEESGELVLRAVHGLSERFLSEGPRFDNQSRFQRFIANGGILKVADVREEPDLNFSEAALAEGICSMLAVGLYKDGDLVGALSVYTSEFHDFTDAEIQNLGVIANQVSIAIKIARLHEAEAEKDRLQRELVLAAEIQKKVMPSAAPNIPGFEIASLYEPWEEIGGDFFDFISLPHGNLGIAVGDVSGKGIWAALLMFVVRTALRAHADYEYAMREIMSRVNKLLHDDTEAEQFATLVYGVLNVPDRVFTYVNASHPPPLLVRDGRMHPLETGGLPVGILP